MEDSEQEESADGGENNAGIGETDCDKEQRTTAGERSIIRWGLSSRGEGGGEQKKKEKEQAVKKKKLQQAGKKKRNQQVCMVHVLLCD